MKRLRFFILAIAIILPKLQYLFGESWIRIYDKGYAIGYSLQLTEDGGCIVVGQSSNKDVSGLDIWLLRLDSLGDTLWTRTYGGQQDDVPYCIQKTSDSCYIITGYTESFGAGGKDLWLLKVDSYGDTLWTRTYGREMHEYGKCVNETSDGGFIITGGADWVIEEWPHLWLLKTDEIGDTTWTQTSNGEYREIGYWVEEIVNGGYVITGQTSSLGYATWPDLWLIKTSPTGAFQWDKLYGRQEADMPDKGYRVKETPDGGFVVFGMYSFRNDLWLLKTDSLGDMEWDHVYRTDGGWDYDVAYHGDQTSDGGYILTGWANNSCFLLKTDSLGDSLWTQFYLEYSSQGKCVSEAEDGGYYVTGEYSCDLFILKTNKYGLLPLEISSLGSYLPSGPDDSVSCPLTPMTEFRNLSTSTAFPPFEYHCDIFSLVKDSVVYQDTVFAWDDYEDILEPWSREWVEFEKWLADTVGEYRISFYASGPFKSRPLTFNFYVSEINPGIDEERFRISPKLSILSPIGSGIVLKYTDMPEGFHAVVYNAAGQKVDELHSNLTSGTVSWGEGFLPGVYFIVPETQGSVRAQKVVLIR